MSAKMSARAEAIFRRTYSRPLDHGFETFDETLDRVIMHQRWLWERAKGKRLSTRENQELAELRQLMLERKVMPAGRTLWLGGTDVSKKREATQFNPAHPDTKFITTNGVKSFRDFSDGDETIVLTHLGNWKPAKVTYAGKQPLYKITFVCGNSTQVEYFSKNHRWLVEESPAKVTTDELLWHKLVPAPFDFYNWDYDSAPIDEQVYWASGLIYGDGTVDSYGNSRIRLCGKDKDKYLQRFIDLNCPYSFPPSCDTDAFVYFGKYKKTPPLLGTEPRLLRAFIHGYLAADGGKDKNYATRHNETRYCTLLVADEEAQEFVRWAFPMVGLYITSERKPSMETNFGPRNPATVVFQFKTSFSTRYSVKAVDYVEDTDVWCLTVEDDESFVLPNGIVTSNCSFLKIETVHDVVDAYWLLMLGCGVGFEPIVGTLNGFTNPVEVEVVRSQRTTKGNPHNAEWIRDGVWHLMVGDSAEAWAKAAGKLLAQKAGVTKLILDFSQVRPAGERLRNYGWISSGDETISDAFPKIATILNERAGQLLTRMNILDIMNLLGTTLSSRRSAEIALVPFGDPEWDDFADAKYTNFWKEKPHRAQSNNSLVFYSKPTRRTLAELMGRVVENGGAEPGFINGSAALHKANWFKGVNPCVPGNTPILTDKGYLPIKALVGQECAVWNGRQFSRVVPFSTGINSLVKVTLDDGTELTCTPTHKFILHKNVKQLATKLRPGDRLQKFNMPTIKGTFQNEIPNYYAQGFYAGDGNAGYEFSWVYDEKKEVIPRLSGHISPSGRPNCVKWSHGKMKEKNWVPVNAHQREVLDWFAGLLDADGTIVNNPNSIMLQISSIDREFLRQIRLMLTRLGVQGKISVMNDAGLRLLPDGRGGSASYLCQTSYRLCINATDTKHLMDLGLVCNRLKLASLTPQRDARRFVRVVSVEDLDQQEETFCFTDRVNGTGTFAGIVTGQCAEILLGNRSFCNLVEVNVSKFAHDIPACERACQIVARANYRQTCVDLRDGVLQSSWHELNSFLRLCGVGLTGICAWAGYSPENLAQLRRAAQQGANGMATELNLPPPKAVTTVKPSGTISKIMDTTEGVHKPLGRFILNNVVYSAHDPQVSVFQNAGYKVVAHPDNPTAVLVTFPQKWDNVKFDRVGELEVNLEPAVSQLARYKEVLTHYADHNVSNTISYSPDEVPAIVDWLDTNWDDYIGVSFLFRTDPLKKPSDLGFAYLPQEVVSEATYTQYVEKIRPLELVGGAEETLLEDGLECSSGVCPIR